MIRIEGISQLRINVKPAARVDALDWRGIGKELDQHGNAMIEQLLSPEECRAIAGLYPNDEIFRSRVVMGRHGFGRGEYKYFSYPLPDLLSELRTAVYSHLVPVANHWNEAMGCGRRRFSFNMESATTTACTRTSTASMSSRSSWPFCFPTPARTSLEESSS